VNITDLVNLVIISTIYGNECYCHESAKLFIPD